MMFVALNKEKQTVEQCICLEGRILDNILRKFLTEKIVCLFHVIESITLEEWSFSRKLINFDVETKFICMNVIEIVDYSFSNLGDVITME